MYTKHLDEGVDLAWESVVAPCACTSWHRWSIGRLVWNLTDVRLGNGLGSDLIFRVFRGCLFLGLPWNKSEIVCGCKWWIRYSSYETHVGMLALGDYAITYVGEHCLLSGRSTQDASYCQMDRERCM